MPMMERRRKGKPFASKALIACSAWAWKSKGGLEFSLEFMVRSSGRDIDQGGSPLQGEDRSAPGADRLGIMRRNWGWRRTTSDRPEPVAKG
jgi:hypothetical protein